MANEMIFSHFNNGWRKMDEKQQRAYYKKKPKDVLLLDVVYMTGQYHEQKQVSESFQSENSKLRTEIDALRLKNLTQKNVISHLTESVNQLNK